MTSTTEPLVLRQATTEQWLQCTAHTHPQWGGGVSLELYKDREKLLREETGDMGSSLICWVLLPASASHDSLDFYSSCETYLRPILHLSPSPSQSAPSPGSKPRKAEKATAYSIASVFTPAQHRRKGYARQMMRLLHDELRRSPSPSSSTPSADEGAPPLLSFLYSDVGNFYSSCPDRVSGKGWEVQGTERTTQWDLSSSLRSPPTSLEFPGWGTKQITVKDLPDIASRDAALLTSSFSSAEPSSSDSDKHPFLVLPTPSSSLWSLTRSAYSFTSRGFDAPSVWGFELARSAPAAGTEEGSNWGFVLLAIDQKEAKSKILRLRLPIPSSSASTTSPSPEQLGAQLIHLAASLARQHGMTKLEGWNISPAVLSTLEGGKKGDGGTTAKRNDSESAVAWYGEGVGKGQVEWKLNEGYAWC